MKLQTKTALVIVSVIAGIGVAQATCYSLLSYGFCEGTVQIAECKNGCVGIEPGDPERIRLCNELYDGEFPDTQGGNRCDTAQIVLTDEITLYDMEVNEWGVCRDCLDTVLDAWTEEGNSCDTAVLGGTMCWGANPLTD